MNQNDEQIRAVIDTWLRASREGDLDTVLGLMTEDVVFLTPGNPPMRREDFAAASQGRVGKVQIDGASEVQEITVTGDLAFCWSRLEITATAADSGTKTRRSGDVLSIFRRGADGQWRIWRDANLLGPASRT